jgi:uncharacterized SAM-binding protein YcdF (DUF218 family)
MEFGALKPLLTSLLMPPLALLLLALLGVLLAWCKKRGGLALTTFSLMLLWLLSCDGVAVWLARTALPQFAPATAAQLKTRRVQAIVILSGGLLPDAPEYGQAQLGARSSARLRYGIWLARQSGLPIAFTGGTGWAAGSERPVSEASVAARVAQQDYGVALRWTEARSRDTWGNARLLTPLLRQDGVQRIALVTDAWHMPRAVAAFERAGLTVSPAPTGYLLAEERSILQWLPSAYGLEASYNVLHECLGLAVGRLIPL